MWRQSRVSSVADRQATRTTCALPNHAPSAARSVTNGWFPSALRIIAHFTASVMKSGGGRIWELSLSGMPIDFGTKPGTHFQIGQVANSPKSQEMKL